MLALMLGACAGAQSPSVLAPSAGFVESRGKQHALVGLVYSGSARQFVSVAQLDQALARAEYVVLGETHDNRDHHALEAELIARFIAAKPNAAVAFEMLDEDVRDATRDPPRDPDAFARAVRWQDSGWPEFAQYRPVFDVALSRSRRLVAAHPSAEHVRASLSGVPADEARALHLDRPLPEAARAQLEDEIRAAHCGHASPGMVTAMVRAQSYKDAFMARAMLDAPAPVVLVAGRGHARADRAVPYYLKLAGASGVLSVAFVEVDDGESAPEAYDSAVFDYVVFTPRVSDADPCERFEEQLKQLHRHGAQSQ